MKKRILLFLIVLIAMTVAYFLYQFYQDDYLPEKVRGHYESDDTLKSFSKNEPKKKFVPRKEFHENTEYKRSDDEVVTIKTLPQGELAMLSADIEKLEMINVDCEKEFNTFMPPNKIIDPINSDYFQNIDSVILDLKRGMTLYGSSRAREASIQFVENAGDALVSYNEVSSEDFSRILRAPFVCRQSNLSILLESIVELAQEGELSDLQKDEIADFMVNAIRTSLIEDRLQDNILMNLTLLKGTGLLAGAEQSFYVDLENIYDELRKDYSTIYDKPAQEKEVIVNPYEVYMEYKSRQYSAASSAIDLIDAYLNRYTE